MDRQLAASRSMIVLTQLKLTWALVFTIFKTQITIALKGQVKEPRSIVAKIDGVNQLLLKIQMISSTKRTQGQVLIKSQLLK